MQNDLVLAMARAMCIALESQGGIAVDKLTGIPNGTDIERNIRAVIPIAAEYFSGVGEAHRYGDAFLDTCSLRKEHREDIVAAIRAAGIATP